MSITLVPLIFQHTSTRCEKQWEVDPNRCKNNAASKIWILENTCLKNLTWDPAELGWKTPKDNIQIFHYSSKIGRNILQHKNLEQEGHSSKWTRRIG